MLRYKVQKCNLTGSKADGKYYGRLTHELMEFDELIKYLAGKNTSFTEGTFQAVLVDTMNALRELLLMGKSVRLGEMGIFSLGMTSEGAETLRDVDKDHKTGFHVANIKGLKVNWLLGKRFETKQLFADATFKEAGKYTPDEGDGGSGDKADTGGDGGGSSSTGGSKGPEGVDPDESVGL